MGEHYLRCSLNMDQQYSLKIKWVQSYLNTDSKGKWKSVFDYYLKKHGGKLLFQGNLKKQDIPLLDIREPFFREIAEQWTNIKPGFQFLVHLA